MSCEVGGREGRGEVRKRWTIRKREDEGGA